MKRTLALPFAALALLASACTSDAESSDPAGGSTVDTAGTPTTDPGDGRNGPVGFAPASLQRFGDCDAFIEYVHTEGVERVGPYGFEGQGFFGPEILVDDMLAGDMAMNEMEMSEADGDMAVEASAPVAPALAQDAVSLAQEQAGGETFSTTNVQVDGVDEPDIIKTDGDRIIAIAGETLHYIDVSTDGTTGTLRGSLRLNGNGEGDRSEGPEVQRYTYGHEIFLAGDRVFVLAQGDGGFVGFPEPFPVELIDDVDEPIDESIVEPIEVELVEPDVDPADERISDVTIDTPDGADAEAGFASPEPPPVVTAIADDPIPVEPDSSPAGGPIGPIVTGPQTVIIEIDVSNPDTPTIANTMYVDGRYISGRSIGNTARLVVTSPPQDLGFLFPSNPDTEDRAEEANRQAVLASTAADWIPGFTLVTADGVDVTGEVSSCSGVHAPSDFSGFDMLSVLTLDLGGDLSASVGPDTETLGGASILASGDTVYASQDRLYVSTNIWEPIIDEESQQWLDENYQTAVHRFSIAGNGPATYEASGSVEGHLLNQFSMNDRDGVLFAATTLGAPWSGENSVSQIVALEMNGDRLEQIGSVGGMGETERIFSVRYVDDTAYVVTFRQTDPFYVVDIADPRNMVVQGELKIPGYSSYLHPIGDDLVLGVGQEATDEGRTLGTKVSLFDVSNPADPLELDVWTMPNGFSDAEFDHRAFLWWAATNTAVLPVQSWNDQFSGAVVLKVEIGSIVEQGRVTQVDESDGVIGQTDCRVLTRDDLGGRNGASEWLFEGGQQINLCTANQAGGAVGMYCDVVPADEVGFLAEELGIDIEQTERIEFCYQEWNGWQTAIQRTLVIDGNLWTLSPERLQSNDLTTLDRTDAIDLV